MTRNLIKHAKLDYENIVTSPAFLRIANRKPNEYGMRVTTPFIREHQKMEARERAVEKVKKGGRMTLYFHIPFCASKCSYCGYISRTPADNIAEAYFAALKNEIAYIATRLSGIKVSSLYFGGGTPTLLAGELLKLIAFVKSKFTIGEDAEITVETHPKTTTEGLLDTLRKTGVTRISIGVQSFSDDLLKVMGCTYLAEEAVRACECICNAGFPRFNIDLIYAYPGQDLEMWIKSVGQAVALSSTEITAYRVRLGAREGKTLLCKQYAQNPEGFPDERLVLRMRVDAHNFLLGKGYLEGPLGWFNKAGLHQQVYIDRWKEQVPLIGFGVSAYSFGRDWQYINRMDINVYVEGTAKLLSDSTAPVDKGMVLSKVEAEKAAEWKLRKFYCLDWVDG